EDGIRARNVTGVQTCALPISLPIALIIIAYASMFPSELSPLQPSLQSPWLYIHVTTVSISQGILGISFVAGLIYLIRQIDQTKRSEEHTSELQSRFDLVCRLL